MAAAPKFIDLRREYKNLWDNMEITNADAVDRAAQKAIEHKEKYQKVEQAVLVPWPVIAGLHMRESGADFSTYLGNGQKLNRRTTLVPKGRGPFKTWEAGAIDAIKYDDLDQIMMEDWSVEMACYAGEKYNGFGPRNRGVNTGYLWSMSNNYERGKYTETTRGSTWNANMVDKQVGMMPMLKRMMELDPSIKFPPDLPEGAIPTVTPSEIQDRLGAMGLLDPPADGVIGSVSTWALEAAGINEELTAHNADEIMNELSKKVALPYGPKDDLAGRIVRAAERRGYWIARHQDCYNIFYIEGMNDDGTANNNRPNEFNDRRVVIQVVRGVPKIVGMWQATTEPSRYWTIRPMNSKGAARIAFGQWKCWVVGTHNQSHEALVQVAPLTVWRDKNKDYSRLGDEQDTGLFGINQHWGYDLPASDLGNSSAGCLVGRMKAGHREFMALIKKDARYKATKSYRFMSTIMPAHWVLESGEEKVA